MLNPGSSRRSLRTIPRARHAQGAKIKPGNAFVLPLDERSYVGRQALLERCFISGLGRILATFTLGEHREFAHAGDGGLYVGPGAMDRSAYGAARCGHTA